MRVLKALTVRQTKCWYFVLQLSRWKNALDLMCSETCKLAIFSQTANRLIKFLTKDGHGHGGKIKCNTKVLSRSCPRRREFSNSDRRAFCCCCCGGRCWHNIVLGVPSVNTSKLKYDFWSTNNNGFLPSLLTKRQPGNNPCPLCIEQLMSCFNQGYLQWEQP